MSTRPRFHLAFPVHDLAAARAFYGGVLGCPEGRSAAQWVDFDLYGHQIVAHLAPEEVGHRATSNVDGHEVPVRHFGLLLDVEQWHALTARLRAAGVPFVIEPYLRFEGQAGEQHTCFLLDGSGNALEFKAFAHEEAIFATDLTDDGAGREPRRAIAVGFAEMSVQDVAAIGPEQPTADFFGRRVPYKFIVAAAFVIGLFMDILDTTIVNVALPTLSKDFNANTNTIEWVVTGYLLSLALWIPASGWIGDRYGTKRTFIFALFMFTAASALCGASWNIQSLIAFRVLQGVGGGMLTPVGTAMLYRAFPPIERPRASSLLAMVTVLAPAIGPVLGGLLVEKASWRWIFYVNLPIGVLGLVFAAKYLVEHTEPTAGGFDLAGFVLSGAGLATLLYGMAEGPVKGWTDGVVLLSLGLSVVCFAALIKVELSKAFPLLDLRLLADRSFRTPNLVSFASFGAMLGLLFLLPQFLQGPRGLSPLESGLTTFPQALGILLTARLIGGVLYQRFGPRRLVMFGMATNAIITLAFYKVGLDTSQWTIRALMFGRGLTMGFGFIPLQAAAFARVKMESTGRASALFQAQRQAGAAVGVAVLATILIERRQALVGSLSGADAIAPTVHAFHDAFMGSVLLAVLGLIAASFIKDSDAAPTMRKRVEAGH